MPGLMPINFKKWIDDHREVLKPPVGNKMVWRDREFIIMVVGGPNARQDFHINGGEEFFYQVEGDMVLKIINEKGDFEDVPINEGEIFLLPAKIPHSPQRAANTVGLVVERKRWPEELDGLMWFCQKCRHKLYEKTFHLADIEGQLKFEIDKYYSDTKNYTCKKCGTVNGKGK